MARDTRLPLSGTSTHKSVSPSKLTLNNAPVVSNGSTTTQNIDYDGSAAYTIDLSKISAAIARAWNEQKGDVSQPIYFDSNGLAQVATDVFAKSVGGTITAETTFNATVHLLSTTIAGSVSASSLTVSGATSLVNNTNTSNVYPHANETYNIGSSALKYNQMYAKEFHGALKGTADYAAKASTANVGSGTKPIYIDSNGNWTASTSNVGDTNKPVYLKAGVITVVSGTYGGPPSGTTNQFKLMYVNSGAFTNCSTTVGSASKPTYLDGGVLKQITSLDDSIVAGKASKWSGGAKGSATRAIYLDSNGIPQETDAMFLLARDNTITGTNTFNSNATFNSSVDIDSLTAGSLIVTGNTTLVNNTSTGNITPAANATYSIGTNALKYNEIYATYFRGIADTASKLSNTIAVGAIDHPVYFTSNGVPAATTYRMAATNVVATTALAITENLNTGIWYVNGTNITGLYGQSDGVAYVNKYSDSWIHEIYGDYRTGQIAVRGKNNGTWQAWRKILDDTNYSSYALPLSGGQMTGPLTWKDTTALPAKTSADYFLVIDAFADGGKTYYINKANVLSSIGAAAASHDHSTISGIKMYTGTTYAGKTYIGWIKFASATMGDSNYLGDCTYDIFIDRIYNSPQAENYSLRVNCGWTNCKIIQLGGQYLTQIIKKFRIVRNHTDHKVYFEFYVDPAYTTYQNPVNFKIVKYFGNDLTTMSEVQSEADSVFAYKEEIDLTDTISAINFKGDLIGNLSSTSGTALTINAGSTLYVGSSTSTSLIFTKGGASTNYELARFDQTGNFVPKSNSNYTIGTNSNKWSNIYATTFTGTLAGNAASASMLTNISSSDAASSTATWRRVWFSYNDNVTGRPAYSDNFTYQTSTGTLKTTQQLIGDNVLLQYNPDDESLNFIFV